MFKNGSFFEGENAFSKQTNTPAETAPNVMSQRTFLFGASLTRLLCGRGGDNAKKNAKSKDALLHHLFLKRTAVSLMCFIVSCVCVHSGLA